MGPPPVVTGISPKEATAGMKLTIRGEDLGVSPQDLIGILIAGSDCLMSADWKSPNKITALCPGSAPEGVGEIIVATRSGGVGSCNVQVKIYKEAVGWLKEVAVWTQEKYPMRRKNRVLSPSGGMEHDDALGLSVEGNELKYPVEELRQMFPDHTGDVGSERFDPVYYLLENHYQTGFEDLQAGLGYLRRKVNGENESQISFIKGNVSSIMDQLDSLMSIKRRFEIDNKEYGPQPTAQVEAAIARAKKEADEMFKEVLGRKDGADATRNALNVLNRFKFLFNLPANIETNLAKGDFDRIIDEYERAKSLYGESDCEIFQIYLQEVAKGVEVLKSRLLLKLQETGLTLDQQKKIIANLVQLNFEGDPAWECLQVHYREVLARLDACRNEHIELNHTEVIAQPQFGVGASTPTSNQVLFPEDDQTNDGIPSPVMFIEQATGLVAKDFPALWKLGQAYFKGDLVVEPDGGKQTVFKEMILGGIRYYSNMIRSAVIPQTLKDFERNEYGLWRDDNMKVVGPWLPSCLRHVRKSYLSFIELDLPLQALNIVKRLTTDLRIQCLQTVFQTVVDQVHLLPDKEEFREDITDDYGAVTELPSLFEIIVIQSVQLIKESLLQEGKHEEDILSYNNAHDDLELMIQNVLSSFAITLENVVNEDYDSLVTAPTDSVKLLLCLNNCMFTQSQVLPKIQKAYQDVGHLSLERPIAEASKNYTILHGKLFEAYLEQKCEQTVTNIEPSMYVGKFDWARCPRPVDARDYIKEIIHNVILVHSEVERISSISNPRHNYIPGILERVVETVAEEVNRLFCCIKRMNSNGCIQAWVDIQCLQESLKKYLNKAAGDFLADSAKPLKDLERPGDREIIDQCIEVFKDRMRLSLAALS